MRETIWLIHPKDDWTNEVVAEQIKAAENAHEQIILCTDGEKRPMWRCNSYDDVKRLETARRRCGLNFDVYRKQGRNASAAKFSFASLRRQKQKKHLIKKLSPASSL